MHILKNSQLRPSVAQPQKIHDKPCLPLALRLSQQASEITKKNARTGLENKKPPV
jgi:hypothetical protein